MRRLCDNFLYKAQQLQCSQTFTFSEVLRGDETLTSPVQKTHTVQSKKRSPTGAFSQAKWWWCLVYFIAPIRISMLHWLPRYNWVKKIGRVEKTALRQARQRRGGLLFSAFDRFKHNWNHHGHNHKMSTPSARLRCNIFEPKGILYLIRF